MAMSMAVPCLASKSFINHHKPAVHLTIALLKLEMNPACRKRMYNNGKEHITHKHARRSVTGSDGLAEVCEFLIQLMEYQSSPYTNSGNKRLSDEIEMFFAV
ncbi:hypothetical protein V6N12_027689 [Hibiscus sabdariffa]|uniref:Uncharacterized protein n=1 Tax=Hibiscus sabdariffa TaxID=183260 RepID=A0ABR2F3M3_9ROSI